MFKLPETLPGSADDLSTLRDEVLAEVAAIRTRINGGEDIDDNELTYLRSLVEAKSALDTAVDSAVEATRERDLEIAKLLADSEDVASDDDESAVETDDPVVAEVVAEAEQATAGAVAVTAAGKELAKPTFAGVARSKKVATPAPLKEVGFRMQPGVHGFKSGLVGFRQIAEAVDSVRPGSRPRSNRPTRGDMAAMALAYLDRDLPLVDDPHALVREIERATALSELRMPKFNSDGALTAAGGWCAPSETLYDFCEVPTATDLISVPEITIRRGGVRWPIEPDLSAIFESFEFFFTEPQLEVEPPVVKNCVEIPCPDEFEELRLNAVGYCVEAGILQAQGWPELIEWFMRSLTQEHFRALSRRTILDMVAGSTPVLVPAASQLAAGSSVLNSLALMATNLRLQKGLGRTAPIEGVAPSWLHEVIRADLANQQSTDTKNVTDAQIVGWLSARNISLQLVGDWQTRGVGQPGNLTTVEYPGTVEVLLYPAGTWFRALSNVIEFGVMYPRELLQINRYTQFFTEDAYAIGKRCNESLVVTIPICPNGAFGAQAAITCNTPADEVQTLTITGTPTGGTFTLTFLGETTAPIAFDAAASAVDAALEALSVIAAGDITASGGALPGTAVVLTFSGNRADSAQPLITADGALLTGGTTPTATVVRTTQGGS